MRSGVESGGVNWEAGRFPIGPDPALFNFRGGRWRIRLEALLIRSAQIEIATLRKALEPHMGAVQSTDDPVVLARIPDDLILTAAVTGPLTNLAFLDLIDGAELARAPCLCCYKANSAAGARTLGRTLMTYLRYYSPRSFFESRAFARTVVTLSRDLYPEEAETVRTFVSGLDSTPDSIRALNAIPGFCVTAPPCRPGVVWIYSTPEGRRLLRHLARALRRGQNPPLRVVVESSDAGVFPRFRYRMYSASFHRQGGPDPADAQVIIREALDWARSSA